MGENGAPAPTAAAGAYCSRFARDGKRDSTHARTARSDWQKKWGVGPRQPPPITPDRCTRAPTCCCSREKPRSLLPEDECRTQVFHVAEVSIAAGQPAQPAAELRSDPAAPFADLLVLLGTRHTDAVAAVGPHWSATFQASPEGLHSIGFTCGHCPAPNLTPALSSARAIAMPFGGTWEHTRDRRRRCPP